MDRELANRFSEYIKIDAEQIIREWWEIILLRELFFSPMGDNLIFKGGTALRLAYGSPRFSDDLDFSIIKKFSFPVFKNTILRIEKKYKELGTADVADKFYTYIAQYKIKEPWRTIPFSIKIEVSKREIDKGEKVYGLMNVKSEVSNIEALGNIVTIDNIYKEKLEAIKTRNEPRDLFDIWYLSGRLKQPYRPPANKFDKKALTQNLRKYLPKNYWKAIDTL